MPDRQDRAWLLPLMLWLGSFRPAPTGVSSRERLRGATGALVGILLTGAVSTWAVGKGHGAALPLLIAPMGASAVLLFAVPASPLAQPWSIIGGNLVASTVGVTVAMLVHPPLLAASLGIGIAVAIMSALRCIHPPSGAVVLTAVLGGPAVTKLAYGFVTVPVLLNSVLLLLVALCFNNATRKRYPHPLIETAADRAGMRRLGFAPEDLDAVLARYDQVLEIARPDLDVLLEAAERHSFARRFGAVTCAEIMSRDVVSVEWGTPLAEAWTLLRSRRLRAMPVTDKGQRVLGVVHDLDFLADLGLHRYRTLAARFRRLLHPLDGDFPGTPEVVGQIMRKDVPVVRDDANIADLVPLLAGGDLRHVPIVNAGRRVVGIVAPSDLIAALYRSLLAS